MTEISYRDTRQYQELYFSGHAEDRIVCAGISAISQTPLENLLREETREQIRLQWKMTNPGEIWMRAWPLVPGRVKVTAVDSPSQVPLVPEKV